MSHGPVMLDLEGFSVTPEEREILQHPATGGVILFRRNYESPEQVEALIDEIRAVRSPNLLIAVDQEGGRVQRLKEGFTELPAASCFGELYKHSRDKARKAAMETGWLMAAELRAVGIDFSFAPVLDLNMGVSSVIGDRSFGKDPKKVGDLAVSWALGAREAGMPSVGKHYPGHGAVAEDSHLALPIDKRSYEDIWQADLAPFRRLIANGLEGIMPAHVIYDQVDDQPAGFSKRWIEEILRHRMDFSGVVFSDDLSMAAANVAGSYADRARIALEAGCDMILVCNNPEGAVEVLDELKDYSNPVAQSRLVRMHGAGRMTFNELHENPRWRQALEMISLATCDESLWLDL